MQIYIETPRLLLRDWKADDLPDFARLNSDPRVMAYFPKTLSPAETAQIYQGIQKEFTQSGFGLYAVEHKQQGVFMGFTGFHAFNFAVDFAPGIEIGWRLLPEYWQQGYATEAAMACLAYARQSLPFQEIYAFTAKLNTRSERVMQKAGLHKIREFEHPGLPAGHNLRPHVLYHSSLSARV